VQACSVCGTPRRPNAEWCDLCLSRFAPAYPRPWQPRAGRKPRWWEPTTTRLGLLGRIVVTLPLAAVFLLGVSFVNTVLGIAPPGLRLLVVLVGLAAGGAIPAIALRDLWGNPRR
jgi:hypothetical protein